MALNPGLMLRSTSPATSDDSPQRGRRGRELQDGAGSPSTLTDQC